MAKSGALIVTLTSGVPKTREERDKFRACPCIGLVLEDDFHHLRKPPEISSHFDSKDGSATADLCTLVLVAHQALGDCVDRVKDEELRDT